MSVNKVALPRDRVICAINHVKTDICPYYIWVDESVKKMLVEYYKDNNFMDNYVTNHSVMKEIMHGEIYKLDDGSFVDNFGAVWLQGEKMLHLVKPALDKPDLKAYKMPEINLDSYCNDFSKWFEDNKTRFKIVQLSMFFFERTWAMRGFENILMDFYENPVFVEELLERLEDVCNKLIDKLLGYFPDKIDAIGFSDDYGAQNNMIISPELWRKYMKPHLSRMFEKIKRGGKYVYLHSCGHITPIIPELIDLGVDILQPIQPESMNIFELKKRFGDHICFAGGISAQKTIPYGTVNDVVNEVKACLKHMAKDGGYIMAPSKSIMQGAPIENVVALIDSIVTQSSY